jgi:hypothetical protein
MNKKTVAASVLLLVLLAWGQACGGDGDGGGAGGARGTVLRDCVLVPPSGFSDLGAPVALEYPEGSLWVFESLPREGGGELRNTLALVSDVDALCAQGPTLELDGDQQPVVALALSEAEVQANAARTDGRRLDLVPLGGFVHEGLGYLYYDQRLSGPGIFDSELLGRGLCIFEEGPTAPCLRVTVGGQTLLWGPVSHPFNRGGLVEGDYALLPGCFRPAAFEDMCTLARAPLASLEDPATYQYHNPFSGWQSDPSNAGVLFNHAGQLSLRWNTFLGSYLALGADIWESQVVAYTAPVPTGPWEGPDVLFDAVPPASFFLAGGVEHQSLAAQGDQLLRLSYFTNTTGPAHGLHLVTLQLE